MGEHAHVPHPGPRRHRKITIIGITLAALTFGLPIRPAAADPEPSLNELSAQVEKLHEEIGTLSEQYNGERVRLKQAQRAAELAEKTLDKSEAQLEERRQKAALLAQNAYMTGGLGPALALTSGDPDSYLSRAATTYALEQQHGEQVAQVTRAMTAAEKARAGAKARAEEVEKIVTDLQKKRGKIQGLVAKAESNLFRRVMAGAAGSAGRAVKINLPVPGAGKAAEAARWALTQQLKPYVWGAEGPNSYDCSGLVMWAYQKVGISLPHYTGSQWSAGAHISRADLRPGDLVFFYNDLHHVGIYLGRDLMVHAPRTGDVVRVASINNRPFAGAVRIAD